MAHHASPDPAVRAGVVLSVLPGAMDYYGVCLKLSKAETLRFIQLYRDHPCLYDANTEEYKDRKKRLEATRSIAAAMSVEGFGPKEVVTKFKNLRNSYSQYLRKMDESQASGAEVDSTPKVYWFDQMDSFLRPQMYQTMYSRLGTCSHVGNILWLNNQSDTSETFADEEEKLFIKQERMEEEYFIPDDMEGSRDPLEPLPNGDERSANEGIDMASTLSNNTSLSTDPLIISDDLNQCSRQINMRRKGSGFPLSKTGRMRGRKRAQYKKAISGGLQKSNIRVAGRNETSHSLRTSTDHKLDLYGHFGEFVAGVLRKAGDERAMLMTQEITGVLVKHIAGRIALNKWRRVYDLFQENRRNVLQQKRNGVNPEYTKYFMRHKELLFLTIILDLTGSPEVQYETSQMFGGEFKEGETTGGKDLNRAPKRKSETDLLDNDVPKKVTVSYEGETSRGRNFNGASETNQLDGVEPEEVTVSCKGETSNGRDPNGASKQKSETKHLGDVEPEEVAVSCEGGISSGRDLNDASIGKSDTNHLDDVEPEEVAVSCEGGISSGRDLNDASKGKSETNHLDDVEPEEVAVSCEGGISSGRDLNDASIRKSETNHLDDVEPEEVAVSCEGGISSGRDLNDASIGKSDTNHLDDVEPEEVAVSCKGGISSGRDLNDASIGKSDTNHLDDVEPEEVAVSCEGGISSGRDLNDASIGKSDTNHLDDVEPEEVAVSCEGGISSGRDLNDASKGKSETNHLDDVESEEVAVSCKGGLSSGRDLNDASIGKSDTNPLDDVELVEITLSCESETSRERDVYGASKRKSETNCVEEGVPKEGTTSCESKTIRGTLANVVLKRMTESNQLEEALPEERAVSFDGETTAGENCNGSLKRKPEANQVEDGEPGERAVACKGKTLREQLVSGQLTRKPEPKLLKDGAPEEDAASSGDKTSRRKRVRIAPKRKDKTNQLENGGSRGKKPKLRTKLNVTSQPKFGHDSRLSFFKSIMPSIMTFSEDEMLEFQARVIRLIQHNKRARLRRVQTPPMPIVRPNPDNNPSGFSNGDVCFKTIPNSQSFLWYTKP